MKELIPFRTAWGGTVIEIGSRDGHDSHEMTRIFRADRTVIVEANPYCYENIILSYPDYECHNLAISNTNGDCDFWAVRPEFGETILGQSSTLYKASYKDIANRITVPAVTMDDFISNNDIVDIRAVKIDVEGATMQLLEGFTRVRDAELLHIESEHKTFWEGQSLFEDTKYFMESNGFEMVYFKPVWVEQSDTIWRRI